MMVVRGVVPSSYRRSMLKWSWRRRGHEREREPEGGALAFSAAQANPAVMLLDDRTADIEAQTEADTRTAEYLGSLYPIAAFPHAPLLDTRHS